MMQSKKWVLAAAAAVALLTLGGCSKQERACVPGESRECACPGGTKGAQVCSADGSKLAACDCPQAAKAPEAAADPAAAEHAAAAAAPAAAPAAPAEFSYTARLGELDHVSTRGSTLATVGAVIRQDRARVHKYRQLDEGDSKDERYGDPKAREALEKLVNAANLPADVMGQILNSTPLVKVTVTETAAKVEIVSVGSPRIGCIIERGRVGGLMRTGAGITDIPEGDPRRVGKIVVGDLGNLEDVTGNPVGRSEEGVTLVITSPTCTTGGGVGIGSPVSALRNDKTFGKLTCVCDGGPGEDNLMLISGPTEGKGTTVESFYAVSAKCAKPVKCETEGEPPTCLGKWQRSDCKITGITISAPFG